MPTEDFIIRIFLTIDNQMNKVKKHSQSQLYPSEIVTLAILFAIKGVGCRAFYRWLKRDWVHLFPKLPERTRLFRLFATHRDWSDRFLASPTILGVIDSFGIELIHPIREGRSPKQIGKKGKSNYRWIVGGKFCLQLNQFGLIVDWDCSTANVADKVFQPLIAKVEDKMVVFADQHFHAKTGDPRNLKLCPRGTWNDRMLVETVFSMLTLICHFKKMMHRKWTYFKMRLAFMVSAFNLLVQFDGLKPDDAGFIPLSIAEYNL
ncbi:MAG: transposase [Calditrichaeota bacterium]|nr:transposase [Calditrichota bacterium]